MLRTTGSKVPRHERRRILPIIGTGFPFLRDFSAASPAAAGRSRHKPRVLILGSGWGGNQLARSLNKSVYDVRLVSPANHFLFTPMLPSTAVGTLEFRAIQEPVRTIPGLAEYYQAKAHGLDTTNRLVHCTDVFKGSEFSLSYDYLIIAVGNKSNTFNTPGVQENEGRAVFFLKHLYHARQIRNRIIECFERASNPTISHTERNRLLSFVVVGGGPTSCEFITELHDFLSDDVEKWFPNFVPHIKLTLCEAGPDLLGSFDRKLADYYLKSLIEKRIDVRTSCSIVGVRDTKDGAGATLTTADLSDGSTLPFGTMVWSAGLAPVKFVAAAGLPLSGGSAGKIRTDSTLRVVGHRGRVFAMGDCARVGETELPNTASVAEQQATYLGDCFNKYYADFDAVGAPADAELPEPGPVHPSLMPWTRLRFVDRMFSESASHFQYLNRGTMTSGGFGKGIVDFKGSDLPLNFDLSGWAAYLSWKGAYASKQLSWSNMILVPMYWFKSLVFGRDISRF